MIDVLIFLEIPASVDRYKEERIIIIQLIEFQHMLKDNIINFFDYVMINDAWTTMMKENDFKVQWNDVIEKVNRVKKSRNREIETWRIIEIKWNHNSNQLLSTNMRYHIFIEIRKLTRSLIYQEALSKINQTIIIKLTGSSKKKSSSVTLTVQDFIIIDQFDDMSILNVTLSKLHLHIDQYKLLIRKFNLEQMLRKVDTISLHFLSTSSVALTAPSRNNSYVLFNRLDLLN